MNDVFLSPLLFKKRKPVAGFLFLLFGVRQSILGIPFMFIDTIFIDYICIDSDGMYF